MARGAKTKKKATRKSKKAKETHLDDDEKRKKDLAFKERSIVGYEYKIFKIMIPQDDGSVKEESCPAGTPGSVSESFYERYERTGHRLIESSENEQTILNNAAYLSSQLYKSQHTEEVRPVSYNQKMGNLAKFECFAVYAFPETAFGKMLLQWRDSTEESTHIPFVPCPCEILDTFMSLYTGTDERSFMVTDPFTG